MFSLKARNQNNYTKSNYIFFSCSLWFQLCWNWQAELVGPRPLYVNRRVLHEGPKSKIILNSLFSLCFAPKIYDPLINMELNSDLHNRTHKQNASKRNYAETQTNMVDFSPPRKWVEFFNWPFSLSQFPTIIISCPFKPHDFDMVIYGTCDFYKKLLKTRFQTSCFFLFISKWMNFYWTMDL